MIFVFIKKAGAKKQKRILYVSDGGKYLLELLFSIFKLLFY